MTTNFEKGKKKAKQLVNKAKKERDTKGYRENLGYDSLNNLVDFLNALQLSYEEESKILAYFLAECDML